MAAGHMNVTKTDIARCLKMPTKRCEVAESRTQRRAHGTAGMMMQHCRGQRLERGFVPATLTRWVVTKCGLRNNRKRRMRSYEWKRMVVHTGAEADIEGMNRFWRSALFSIHSIDSKRLNYVQFITIVYIVGLVCLCCVCFDSSQRWRHIVADGLATGSVDVTMACQIIALLLNCQVWRRNCLNKSFLVFGLCC